MEAQHTVTRSFSLAMLLVLCVAGLLIAIELQGGSVERVCQSTGCQQVLSSQYSHVGPWSLASIGAGFYASMILLWAAMVGLPASALRRGAIVLACLVSAASVVISILLLCIQLLLVRAFCPLCCSSTAICFVITLVLFYLWQGSSWRAQPVAAVAALTFLTVLGIRFWSDSQVIVGRIGRATISRADMEKAMPSDVRQSEWEIYRQQKDWLDQKITDILVQREAAVRHISPAELVQRELNDPVDQQVEQFMQQHSEKLSDADKAVVRQEIRARFKADRAEEFVRQLMQKYGAREYLPAPIMDEKDLAGLPGWHRGADAANAPIRLVIFSDFGCEYCAHSAQAIDAVMKKFAGQVSSTFHYLPLEIHPRGEEAAIAAECAGEQNQFWKFHDALMSHGGKLGGVDFDQLAGNLGLDQQKFRACEASDATRKIVEQSKLKANSLGIDSTPALFLNGRRIGGDMNEAALLEAITANQQ